MCGIAGIAAEDASVEGLALRVKAMTEAQRHRGPDDEGVEIVSEGSPAVVLGHRRLSIIDLSPAGHQPMRDPLSGSTIVFNGEIYNFMELRRELEAEGCAFRSRSDTEVILKAVDQWGEAAVSRLRGIFAFAIWRRGGELLLARDPLGVKPLYFRANAAELIFASEVRALIRGGVSPRIDALGLTSYLAYGSVQEPVTILQGVNSLAPGALAVWRPGRYRETLYWDVPAMPRQACASARESEERVAAGAAEAVRAQLVSDVPIGVFLSGGIDSSVIAALAQKAARGPVRTVSIVFDEPEFDERIYARAAAARIGTEHVEVTLEGKGVRDGLDAAMDAFDLPSMDGLNTYFVSQATRGAGLTVALSGLGGDELFGGYDGYWKALLAERAAALARPILSPQRMGRWRGSLTGFRSPRSLRRVVEACTNPVHPYLATRRVFDSGQIEALLPQEMASAAGAWEAALFSKISESASGYDAVTRASIFEMRTYMRSTLLRDTDQMSMAHALEVRVPLLDQHLVELALSIDGPHKVDREQPKPLLTRPLRDLLPDECVHRPKRGFVLPFARWLRGPLREVVKGALLPSRDEEVWPLLPRGVERAWLAFERGQMPWSRVWSLFMLLRWLKRQGVTA